MMDDSFGNNNRYRARSTPRSLNTPDDRSDFNTSRRREYRTVDKRNNYDNEYDDQEYYEENPVE